VPRQRPDPVPPRRRHSVDRRAVCSDL